MTRVKICGIRNESDLDCAVRAGADAVGFLVGRLHASPHYIPDSVAARLAAACPPFVEPVLVTHFTDPGEIAELAESAGIRTIQLHGGSAPEQVAALRDRLPPASKIIASVHLTSEKQVPGLPVYFPLADAILLDSALPAQNRVGGTGIPCDWNLAARFAAFSPLPVILAGGLAADNAADAVLKVRPFAVDANSRLKNDSGEVDFERCRAFCRAVAGTL